MTPILLHVMLPPSFQTIYEIYRPAKHTHDAIFPCITHQNLQEPFCSLQGSTCSFEGNNDYQLFILYHGDIGDFPKVYNCF